MHSSVNVYIFRYLCNDYLIRTPWKEPSCPFLINVLHLFRGSYYSDIYNRRLILSILEHHIKRTMQYVFWVWLLWLNIVFFTHPCVSTSFFSPLKDIWVVSSAGFL